MAGLTHEEALAVGAQIHALVAPSLRALVDQMQADQRMFAPALTQTVYPLGEVSVEDIQRFLTAFADDDHLKKPTRYDRILNDA